MHGPLLSGIRVLDLSAVGPATRASRWLADYGADVTRVEPVRSERAGAAVPPFHSYGAGRGWSRIRINLKEPAGKEAFLALADHADVVLESFRPGVVARLGVGYDAVRARNPGIVYCSTTGYGQSGEYAEWTGHDLNYLAAGGFLGFSGPGPDGGPALPGTTVADTAAGGMHALAAILAALLARQRSGEGSYLDVSVRDGVLALMSLQIDAYLATGADAGPGDGVLHGQYACYGAYRARDGRWLTIAAIEPKFWANLCRALGIERWVDRQLDDGAQEEIRADISRIIGGRDRDEWMTTLPDADACVAPVLSMPELAADADLAAKGLIGTAVHPTRGAFRQMMPTLAGMVRPLDTPIRLPGEDHSDCEELMIAAGYTPHEVSDLRERGVIG